MSSTAIFLVFNRCFVASGGTRNTGNDADAMEPALSKLSAAKMRVNEQKSRRNLYSYKAYTNEYFFFLRRKKKKQAREALL